MLYLNFSLLHGEQMLLVFDCEVAKVLGIVEKENSPSPPLPRELRQAQLSLRILVEWTRVVEEGWRKGGQPFLSCQEQLSWASLQLLTFQLSQERQGLPREGRWCPAKVCLPEAERSRPLEGGADLCLSLPSIGSSNAEPQGSLQQQWLQAKVLQEAAF